VTVVRVHQTGVMGTVLTTQIIAPGESRRTKKDLDDAVERVLGWFRRVEDDCSRFDRTSELRRLCATVGRPVRVSALLFNAIEFAIAVATDTEGAFDPTVGGAMEERGFDTHHRTGRRDPAGLPGGASFRDVELDATNRTVTLHRPLLLDLGAIAKGLAIDLAAQELRPFGNFAIDAGGDLYAGGHNADGERWAIGIRHPRDPEKTIDRVSVSDAAVCTSGDYERRSPVDAGHHIIDPRAGTGAPACASVTVCGPGAMVADAMATAAFVLGPAAGIALLTRHELEGMFVTPTMEIQATSGWQALHAGAT
jgi:thiamine biosynthesis lipoprotein